MPITFTPIGHVKTQAQTIPRHWSVSEEEGALIIDEQYAEGLKDIHPGRHIVVLFHFHKSEPFSPDKLVQGPPHKEGTFGVFSICSPRRPNPIGMSVVEVLAVEGNVIRVKGIDMLDGTPIFDLKPHIPLGR